MLERLKRLEENLLELERLRSGLTLASIRKKEKEWAIRYGLLECIQVVIDVSCFLASDRNLGHPKTYADCIRLLRDGGYISPELAERLVKMVGLRNILVHEYLEVSSEELVSYLDQLDDFRKFALEIGNIL